jgi:hypothetical protein
MITAAYRILRIKGTETILCLLCDRYSAHPQDIAYKYCGWCHVWLDQVPMTYDPEHQPRLQETPRCG